MNTDTDTTNLPSWYPDPNAWGDATFDASMSGIRHGILNLSESLEIDVHAHMPGARHSLIATVHVSFDLRWNLFAAYVDVFGYRWHFDTFGLGQVDSLEMSDGPLHACARADVLSILRSACDRVGDVLESGHCGITSDRARTMIDAIDLCIARS